MNVDVGLLALGNLVRGCEDLEIKCKEQHEREDISMSDRMMFGAAAATYAGMSVLITNAIEEAHEQAEQLSSLDTLDPPQ